jgi:hypothetical protein
VRWREGRGWGMGRNDGGFGCRGFSVGRLINMFFLYFFFLYI